MVLNKTLEEIKKNSVLIEIYGLGYVGFPLAIRLASAGLKVVGIDVNQERIERLKNDQLMDSELNLKNEFKKCKDKKTLVLANSPSNSDSPKIGIICVPTPIPEQKMGSDIFVKDAVENFLSFSKPGDIIILESSIEVGTTDKMKNLIESKGFKIGQNYGLCFCPERIDPKNKEWGIENIPRIIYSSDDLTFKIAKEIYRYVNDGNLIRVNSPLIAEVVKSFENAFRLVNISLVNELAILCDKLKINVKDVIDAASTKPFGFLAHYPGAGAGGHCIPKDPRFLLESAKKFDIRFSTIENALKINSHMPIYICNSIEKILEELNLEKNVLICGLTYKTNVEDMRDSPSFKIVSQMRDRNFKVLGYDPFFKSEVLKKYLKENNLSELNFKPINNLNDDTIKNVSCICIVQHHDQVKNRLNEIYNKSIVPFIYDCQNKIIKNSTSKTKLHFLGN